MIEREIIAEARASLVAWNRHMAEHCAGATWIESDGLAWKSVGFNPPSQNGVCVIRPLPRPRDQIAEALARYDDAAIEGGVLISAGLDPAAEAACLDLGLSRAAEIPVLALHPLPASGPSPPRELEIRIVRSVADHRLHVDAEAAGFEGDPAISHRLFPDSVVDAAERIELTGFVDNIAVATAVTYISGQDAGVYGVATHPAYRRRGYGEALTRAAVHLGCERGCTLASLQPSLMARPMYERIGFREITRWHVYGRAS